MRPLTLSDGTVLPKGARIMVCGRFQDPELYEHPTRFNAARFLNLRSSGLDDVSNQYVSTSSEMFGFGKIADHRYKRRIPCADHNRLRKTCLSRTFLGQ